MTEATSPNARASLDRTHDDEGLEAADARRVILARRARYMAMALAAAGAATNAGPGCTQPCPLPPMTSDGMAGDDTHTGGATGTVLRPPQGGSAGSAGAAGAAGVAGFAGAGDLGPWPGVDLFAGMSPCLIIK